MWGDTLSWFWFAFTCWAPFHVSAGHCMSSLEKCLFRYFACLLIGLFPFFLLGSMSSSYILHHNPVWICGVPIFSSIPQISFSSYWWFPVLCNFLFLVWCHLISLFLLLLTLLLVSNPKKSLSRPTSKSLHACLVTQLCLTQWPYDCRPPVSSVHGIFFRIEYWSGLPFPPPEDLHDPRIEPMSPVSPAL